MAQVKVLSWHFPEGAKQVHENLSHSGRSVCQNLIMEPTEYDEGVLRLWNSSQNCACK